MRKTKRFAGGLHRGYKSSKIQSLTKKKHSPFWKSMQEGDFGHLLDDAERVRKGGSSSYARAKKQATKEGKS